jgi:hypothetical protein
LARILTGGLADDTLVIGNDTSMQGTFDECKTACNSTPMCKGFARSKFSEISPDISPASERCWFKSNIGSTRVFNPYWDTIVKV